MRRTGPVLTILLRLGEAVVIVGGLVVLLNVLTTAS